MSIKGFNINGSVEKYDYRSLDNLPSDTGLSEQAKRALLACFEQVAWIGADGQNYYDSLEQALYPQGYVSVTNTLVGCKTTNEATSAAVGKPYNATIIADSGYTLTGANVIITMGGTSVTGYYSNGAISIPNVTGDIVIQVTATSAISSISAVFTQGSATIYDTDSLDTLRQYLTVTATFSDSTTATVTDYTLSGVLTVGTSTITVSYGGKTTTFNVTVSKGFLWTFANGYSCGKGTSSGSSSYRKIFRQTTAARACGSGPIENKGYVFTVTDSAKYNLAAYDVTDNTPQSTSYSAAVDGVWYQGGTKSVSWEESDSTTAAYVWLALKKMDGTSFTDEELANGAEAVFTYTEAT